MLAGPRISEEARDLRPAEHVSREKRLKAAAARQAPPAFRRSCQRANRLVVGKRHLPAPQHLISPEARDLPAGATGIPAEARVARRAETRVCGGNPDDRPANVDFRSDRRKRKAPSPSNRGSTGCAARQHPNSPRMTCLATPHNLSFGRTSGAAGCTTLYFLRQEGCASGRLEFHRKLAIRLREIASFLWKSFFWIRREPSSAGRRGRGAGRSRISGERGTFPAGEVPRFVRSGGCAAGKTGSARGMTGMPSKC